MKRLNPVTPGELLREEFLIPMAISQYRLAKEIGVPAQRISEIVAGRRAVTADTDLRLCRFFGLSKGYWLRAQAVHDTEVAEDALAEALELRKDLAGVLPFGSVEIPIIGLRWPGAKGDARTARRVVAGMTQRDPAS